MRDLSLGPWFWRRVRFGSCFEWQGPTSKGYGIVRVDLGLGRRHWRRYYAHRLVWEVLNGPIPEGMCVLHHCDNRGCVNPRHLWLGSARDNDDNRVAKDRSAKGEANGGAKLTVGAVIDLRADAAAGMDTNSLSHRYGVSKSQVGRIIRRKKWAHV